MSYKSREKKRRAGIAIERERARTRAGANARHYLTIVSRPCCCNTIGCGRSLRRGAECVYRHTPREILCVDCARRRGIAARPSLRWERQARRKRNRRRT